MSREPGADELRIRALLVAQGVGPDGIPPKPTVPPRPAARPRDWLDDILDDDPEPAAEGAVEDVPEPKRRKPSRRLPDWWRDKPERLPNPDDDPEDDPEPDAEDTPDPDQADEDDSDGDEPSPATAAKPEPASKTARKKRKRPKPGAARAAWDSRPPSPRQSLADAWEQVPGRLKWLAYHASAAYLGWSMGLVGWSTYVTAWIADTGLVGPQAVFWYAAAAGTVLIYRRTRSLWVPVAWLAAVPVTSTVVGVLLYAPHP